jgi:hypothetical protein
MRVRRKLQLKRLFKIAQGERRTTWEVDHSLIDREMHDAQGETQQFLGAEDRKEDLFGDGIEIISIEEFNYNAPMNLVKKQEEYGRLWANELKDKMMGGIPLPPVTLWKNSWGNNKYKLVSGRHRLTAAVELGMTHVPALIMYWRKQ